MNPKPNSQPSLRRFLRAGAFLSLLALQTSHATAAQPPISAAQADFFEKKIRPVLVTHCYDCHSEESGKTKGELSLDTREGIRGGGGRGPAVVPGKVESSSIILALRHTNPNFKMPPEKSGPKLPDAVIADFEQWIRDGAPDPRNTIVKSEPGKPEKKIDWDQERTFWAFLKPKPSTPPAVKDAAWPKSPVDRFILAKLEEKKLKPVADADRTSLLRRVHYDLTGLPPTPSEIAAFVKDRSPQAFEKVVDRLLATPQFGERWGRRWLDVARYGESSGKDRNITFPYAWRYRDYVIDSFNQDKPFDRFVREQIAGDLLPAANAQERDTLSVATGFLAVGPKGLNETRPKNFKWDVVDDQIDTTTRALLGLTVACARCHDHKFDAIGTRDYHALGGIFGSTETLYGTIGGGGNRRPSTLLSLAGAPELSVEFIRPALNGNGNTNAAGTNQLTRAERQRRRAERLAAGSTNAPADNAEGSTNANAVALAAGLDLTRGTNVVAAGGATNDLAARTNAAAANRARFRRPANGTYAMGVREGNPADAPIFFRGDVAKPKEVVPRGFLRILADGTQPAIPENVSGRLELANWIANPENPLTARVLVNRVWQDLFGAGIVATADNFGKLGARPTHPELLDYLALRFTGEQKWSVKQLVRSLVLSRTYQLSSHLDPVANEVDAQNTLLWRATPRRLDAELIRDSVLAASGRLDLTRPTNGSLTAVIGNGYIGANVDEKEFQAPLRIRSVYLPVPRDLVPESLALFDFADPNLVTAKREESSSPVQALYLLNNGFIRSESVALAKRLLTHSRQSESSRVREAYLAVLHRSPTDAEVKAARQFLAAQTHEFSSVQEAKPVVVPSPAPGPLAQAGEADSGTLAGQGGSNAQGHPPAEKPTVPEATPAVSSSSTNAPTAGRRLRRDRPVAAVALPAPEVEPVLTPRESAWASFSQALFASAEFRYIR